MRASAAFFPKLRLAFRQFATDIGAATAIEYALIAAGVGAAVAGTIYSLGTTVQDTLYNKIADAVD